MDNVIEILGDRIKNLEVDRAIMISKIIELEKQLKEVQEEDKKE